MRKRGDAATPDELAWLTEYDGSRGRPGRRRAADPHLPNEPMSGSSSAAAGPPEPPPSSVGDAPPSSGPAPTIDVTAADLSGAGAGAEAPPGAEPGALPEPSPVAQHAAAMIVGLLQRCDGIIGQAYGFNVAALQMEVAPGQVLSVGDAMVWPTLRMCWAMSLDQWGIAALANTALTPESAQAVAIGSGLAFCGGAYMGVKRLQAGEAAGESQAPPAEPKAPAPPKAPPKASRPGTSPSSPPPVMKNGAAKRAAEEAEWSSFYGNLGTFRSGPAEEPS